MTPNQLPPLPEPDGQMTVTFGIDEKRKVPVFFGDRLTAYALAALAQQAQEPVAWLYVDTVGERYLCFSRPTGGGAITNLYATPPAPQVPPKCLTCSGHGEIGGHLPDGSGHGEPCPACNAPQVPAPVDERDELEADMADKAAVMPAAVVAEVYQSRYTIEWVNGPMPLGTNLYAGPKVVKAWAEEVRKLRAERDALAALQSPAPQTKGQS